MGIQEDLIINKFIRKLLPIGVKKKIYALGEKLYADLKDHENEENTDWTSFADDVYLVSYPRSGNTWLRYLLTNLRFPEAIWDVNSLTYAFPEIGSKIDISCVPKPRWIKSHHTYTPDYPKVIYLYRDGRDVAVSFYYWSGACSKMSFESYCRQIFFHDNDKPWGMWTSHLEKWLYHRDNVNMLVVKYEDLVTAPFQNLGKICEFLGLLRTKKDFRVAMERSSIERQQSDFNKSKILSGRAVGVSAGPGKWKEYFDKKLNDEFWKIAGNTLESEGYKKDKSI